MPLEIRDKGTSATQLEVRSGEVVIAAVYKAMPSVMGEVAWCWSFRMTAGPPGFQQHGSAPTFAETKAAVETQWARWVAATGLRDDGA